MSASTEAIQCVPEDADGFDEMIAVLDEVIGLGLRKLTGDGRSKDTDKAEARCAYMKRTEQAISAKRQVVKDEHLQETGRALEALEGSGDLDL